MLTQAEIDALLSGSIEIEQPTADGSVNLAEIMGQSVGAVKTENKGKQVRPYNFWSPDHFSKDQMRAIELIHEDLAERLTSSLPPFVRTNVRPRVVHTEQGRFHDFLKDLPDSVLYHMIVPAPLPGQMVITISPEISAIILSQRLGGQGIDSDKIRQLTEIDQFLLRGMVEHMLNDIKASWSKMVSIEPGLEDSTTNQHWVQMVMGNERVMLITFELTLQNATGTMNIYIPFTMLKPIASVLNPHVWFSGRKERHIDSKSLQAAEKGLAKIGLTMQVMIGNTRMKFDELVNLKPGDIIPLDTLATADLSIMIANREVFKGRPGKLGQRMAVQITSLVKPEE